MSRTLLAFLHGPLVGPLTWRAVAARLAADGYPVVAPDLRAPVLGRTTMPWLRRRRPR